MTGARQGHWQVDDQGRLSMDLKEEDGTVTYQGVFARLPRDKDHRMVMTFSALGNNLCIWGSKR